MYRMLHTVDQQTNFLTVVFLPLNNPTIRYSYHFHLQLKIPVIATFHDLFKVEEIPIRRSPLIYYEMES